MGGAIAPSALDMKRPWEYEKALASVPFGWRRTAWCAMAIAAEHGLAAQPFVRWSATAHPACPSLQVVESGLPSASMPANRQSLQRYARTLIEIVVTRATLACMACGTTTSPPAHVALRTQRVPWVALLCAECEAFAAAEAYDFWLVLGRLDPQLFDDDGRGGAAGGWRFGHDDREPTDEKCRWALGRNF